MAPNSAEENSVDSLLNASDRLFDGDAEECEVETANDEVESNVAVFRRKPRSQKKREKLEIARRRRKELRSGKRRKRREKIRNSRIVVLSAMNEEERRAFLLREKAEMVSREAATSQRLAILFDYQYNKETNSVVALPSLMDYLRESEKKIDDQSRSVDYENVKVLRICINCSFNDLMSTAELSSLAKQISYCYLTIKRDPHAFIQLILTSFEENAALHQRCKHHGIENWKVRLHAKPLWDIFSPEEIVILSPDADEMLEELDASKVYVICGLVDRCILKNQSRSQATLLGLHSRRLPIKENLPNCANPVLNINAVVDVLNSLSKCNNWKESLAEHVPTRKTREIRAERRRQWRALRGPAEKLSLDGADKLTKESTWCSGKSAVRRGSEFESDFESEGLSFLHDDNESIQSTISDTTTDVCTSCNTASQKSIVEIPWFEK